MLFRGYGKCVSGIISVLVGYYSSFTKKVVILALIIGKEEFCRVFLCMFNISARRFLLEQSLTVMFSVSTMT